MKNSSRNLGIDTLRIVSMLCVVVLHVLGHGGVLKSFDSPIAFSVLWFLEIAAFPAVNCFVLISGYVGYKGDKIFPKIKNLLSLLFTVVFYSVLITVLFKFFRSERIGMLELLKSFFPTITSRYWFFTSYFGMFLVSPFLHTFVYRSSLKQDIIFLAVLFFLGTVSMFEDAFSLAGGYSVIWFVAMYLTGAIIKKYNLNKLFSKKTWLILTVCAFTVTWLWKIVLHFVSVPLLSGYNGALVNYVSPTMVIMAIGLFGIFSNMDRISCGKLISFFSGSAFSVYLIHDNIYVRKYIISRIYSVIGGFDLVFLILSVLGIASVIFIGCILIDKIRIYLFKLIKTDKLAQCAEDFIKVKINLICQRLDSVLGK